MKTKKILGQCAVIFNSQVVIFMFMTIEHLRVKYEFCKNIYRSMKFLTLPGFGKILLIKSWSA